MEKVVIGWDQIAAMFGVSKRTMLRKREELRQCGAIFYMYRGRPPRRVVAAFPSFLKTWACLKSSEGELI